MTDETLAVIERFNAALERHDIDGLLAEMTADTVFENTSPAPDGTRLQGIAAIHTFFTEFFETNPHTTIRTKRGRV
jgi:ketosteroid isomerase-like protein